MITSTFDKVYKPYTVYVCAYNYNVLSRYTLCTFVIYVHIVTFKLFTFSLKHCVTTCWLVFCCKWL